MPPAPPALLPLAGGQAPLGASSPGRVCARQPGQRPSSSPGPCQQGRSRARPPLRGHSWPPARVGRGAAAPGGVGAPRVPAGHQDGGGWHCRGAENGRTRCTQPGGRGEGPSSPLGVPEHPTAPPSPPRAPTGGVTRGRRGRGAGKGSQSGFPSHPTCRTPVGGVGVSSPGQTHGGDSLSHPPSGQPRLGAAPSPGGHGSGSPWFPRRGGGAQGWIIAKSPESPAFRAVILIFVCNLITPPAMSP